MMFKIHWRTDFCLLAQQTLPARKVVLLSQGEEDW